VNGRLAKYLVPAFEVCRAVRQKPRCSALRPHDARGTYTAAVDLGPAELLIILLVVLLLFGGAKLPELARSLGRAKQEFESASRGAPSTTGHPAPDRSGTSATSADEPAPDAARPTEAEPPPAAGEP
jgi:sec-independent protein translocase protein TatA